LAKASLTQRLKFLWFEEALTFGHKRLWLGIPFGLKGHSLIVIRDHLQVLNNIKDIMGMLNRGVRGLPYMNKMEMKLPGRGVIMEIGFDKGLW